MLFVGQWPCQHLSKGKVGVSTRVVTRVRTRKSAWPIHIVAFATDLVSIKSFIRLEYFSVVQSYDEESSVGGQDKWRTEF